MQLERSSRFALPDRHVVNILKIWHIRPSVGSATRMPTIARSDHRYQDIILTLELKGVPPYLAPTWEQWFDPENPRPAGER